MIVGHGFVRHVDIDEFVSLMEGKGYWIEDLEVIWNDLIQRAYDNEEYIEFDEEEIQNTYKVKNIIYAQDERERDEFRFNKELGLKEYNTLTGGFIEDWIKDENIIFSTTEKIICRL